MKSEKVEFENIQIVIGDHRLLNNGYLVIEKGSIRGLLGRNGTGKSSIFNVLFGRGKAKEMYIRLNNKQISVRELRSELKYLPQHQFIPKRFNLMRVFGDYGVHFEDFLKDFPDIKISKNTKIEDLSGGERRLVECYIILNTAGSFCILDEPFSHVMPVYVERLKKLIVKAKLNKGILISDHAYQDVWNISDITFLIKNGSFLKIGNIEELTFLGYLR